MKPKKVDYFCPSCGAKLPAFKWEKEWRYLPWEGETICKKCKSVVVLAERSTIDQDNVIQIVFH